MKRVLIVVITWVLFALLGYCFGYVAFDQSRLEDLVEGGQPVYGKVISLERENHRAVGYRYVVNGNEYTGLGGSGFGNSDFDHLHVGQDVVVFYDPESPEVSFLGYPEVLLKANERLIWFITFVLPIPPVIFVVGLHAAVRRTRANLN